MKILLLMLAVAAVARCESIRTYEGFKVYEVTPTTESHANFIHSLADDENFDFWSLRRPVGAQTTVMVSPDRQRWFENMLESKNIPHKISIMDLERALNNERQSQLNARRDSRSSSSNGSALTFDRYYRHDEINKYLDSLAESHEDVEVRSIGKSYEGREIKAIKLGKGGRNSIYIDGGIHAREWIAVATTLYLIDQLTAGNSSSILDRVDVIIQPVVNPDGYEYSHRLDRLWRKTRSGLLPASCRGTDGNRNFDFHWGEVGASPNQCSETYRGPKAFSEKETMALRDAVSEMKDTCKFYLTLHSYGNYLLYPWGYTSDLPESWREIDEIARVGAAAIENATGTKYTVGSSTNVLYAAAGGSDDYMFGALDIPISITMELPGGGSFGFDMPANRIEETVKESAIGIFAMIEAVAKKYSQ